MAEALTVPLKSVRDQLTDKCVRVLAAYRKHCATPTSPGQVSATVDGLYAKHLTGTAALAHSARVVQAAPAHHGRHAQANGAVHLPGLHEGCAALHHALAQVD